MGEIQHPTKIHKILYERGLTKTDLYNLIMETNNNQRIQKYILYGIVNGSRTNYNVRTLKMLKNAFPDISYEDIID